MGRGGGSAETRRRFKGKKRAASGEVDPEDEREAISRRLPDEPQDQGRKRAASGDVADDDARESVSRRLPDADTSDQAGAVNIPKKKTVRWDSDVKEFEKHVAWGGSRRDMATVRAKLGCGHDVSEIYSPPRVVKMAKTLGMKGGVSLDLTVPANDGYIWDFSRKHCRDRATQIVNEAAVPDDVAGMYAVFEYSKSEYEDPDGEGEGRGSTSQGRCAPQVLCDSRGEADGGRSILHL